MAGPSVIPEGPPPCPACGYLADPGPGKVNFCPKCGQDLRPGAAPRTQTNALLGEVIADRYRLIALLGEGGMGAVYKAEHIRMGKALAVKILRGDFARDPAAAARFRAEAQIVSRLSHPHTIAVFDFGEIEALGGFYLAMEYVPGKDLAQVLRDGGRLEEPRAAAIAAQILGSLAEAHEAGIVHRDMKPGNVMLMQTRPGEDFAKVLDFGIAKLRDEGASTTTTSAGAIVGTPNYLAPEQARGDAVDPRTDLYAVGCLLYELVAGRPPFVAPTPMAVVAAHLHDPPPPLAEVAPGTSRRLAEIVHRALRKRPAERFESADAFRDALLALDEPTASRPLAAAAGRRAPQVTGELVIARREDFKDFDRQVRALRRSRVAAPLSALVLLGAVGGIAWRWPDAYALLAARAPALARALPPALRPSDHFDGQEQEPNDVAARATRLPLPPGNDGRPGGGVAVTRGFIGAKLNETTGDTDVYRLDLPVVDGRKVLVAEWRGARAPGEGIRGLDVSLSLNRERVGADGRTSAPLVASADRGGPGQPERLVGAVRPGAYYLSVREKHGDATGPVEKPTDPYLLEVRLEAPGAGEEVEPNDAPDEEDGQSYPAWRALAELNALAEGSVAEGETAPDDADTWAVAARGSGEAQQDVVLVALVPEPGLALAARRWIPGAADLAPGAAAARFEDAGQGGPGELVLVPIPEAARADVPVLVMLRGVESDGRYAVLALGPGPASGAGTTARVRALAETGRLPAALELAAAFATEVPRSPAARELLAVAGGLADAEAARLTPDDVRRFDRAGRALGAPVFEVEEGKVRYRAAFEARVEGRDRLAETAALRVVRLAAPCTPEAVAARVDAFADRFPEAEGLAEARRWRARALEAALAAGGGKDAALRAQAVAAWERLEAGGAADEARAALARLAGKVVPEAPAPVAVCPDPGAAR
jgi:eukaryotic-like serine/threonine-protein kinase